MSLRATWILKIPGLWEICSGICIVRKVVLFVLVTHAPDVAMWADRVVVLKDGSIVDDRSTAEFAGPAELSSFYERTLNDVL